MKKVAIVVGHSHKEPGAVSRCGITEYEFNSQLAPLLAAELHKEGIQPIIVYRDTLSKLPSTVNATKADMVISLHCNAFNKRVRGCETLHAKGSSKGKHIAEVIQKAISKELGLLDRGVIAVDEEDRGGYILHKTRMPAVLIEPAFIDNPKDFNVLKTNKDKLAKVLAKSISSAM